MLAILVFEVAGYGTLTLHNQGDTEEALLKVRQRQLTDVFDGSTSRLNGLTDYMESVARGLAIAGTRFRPLKQAGVDVVPEVQAYLTQSVTQLPDAIGGGLWYEPRAFDAAELYFGPYVSRDKGAVKFTWDLNTPSGIRMTERSSVFLIDGRSGLIIADPANPGTAMTPAAASDWLSKISTTIAPNQLQTIPSITVAGVASVVKYAKTNAGLVFGIRVPLEEFGAEATAILRLLFRPFQHVVQLIGRATSKRDARGEVVVEPISYRSDNEFKGIVVALNTMVAGISERDQRLAVYASGLEHNVADRTAELNQRNDEVAARNDEMRRVMNNVNQGLLTVGRDGVVAAERSAAVARWFADDGRGIRWERLADKARAAGRPRATQAELVAALFADGISTNDEATELSGRGVGTAAVLSTVEGLGGTVSVVSEPGQGTRFTFRFPLDAAPLRTRGATVRVAFAAEGRAA